MTAVIVPKDPKCENGEHDPEIVEITVAAAMPRKIFKCKRCGIDLGAVR